MKEVYGKPLKKKMVVQLHTDPEVAVKHCGRFIITQKSVFIPQKQQKGKK